MQKSNLADYIDSVLCFTALFIISITVFNYFRTALWLNLVASFCCALILTALFILAFKRNNKKKIDKDEKPYFNDFLFLGNTHALSCLKKALGDLQSVNIDFAYKDGIKYFVFLKEEKLKVSELSAIYKYKQDCDKIVIFTSCGLSDKAAEICTLLSAPEIELKTFSDFYSVLKENNSLPALTLSKPKSTKGLKLFAHAALDRKRCRGYAFACFALLLGTLFSPYKAYYLIAAALCLLLALICLCDVVNKKEKNLNKDKS